MLVGTSFGFFVGCVFSDYGSASAVTGIVVNLPMMFNGVFANINAFPGYLRWISYISIFRYAEEALAYNEFDQAPPINPPNW